jgi:hypothetical protein
MDALGGGVVDRVGIRRADAGDPDLAHAARAKGRVRIARVGPNRVGASP